MVDISDYIKIFTGLVAIVNPIGAIPIFLGLMHDYSASERKKAIKTTVLTVFIALNIIMLFGEPLLSFFGISVSSFRVGGGMLIIIMAIQMMQGRNPKSKHNPEEKAVVEDKESVAVVPLAIPLLAGPGAISSTIVYSSQGKSFHHFFILSGIILVSVLVIWLILSLAPKIADILGRIGINIVTRIMGLIMAAIGVEFIVKGLTVLLPGLS